MTTPTTLPDARAALLHTMDAHGWRRLIGTVQYCDALDLLRALPDGCVDMVVTSPPYNLGKAGRSGGGFIGRSQWVANFNGGYESFDDDLPERDYQKWIHTVVRECLRVSRGLVWVNHKTRYRDGVAIHPRDFLPFPMWSEIVWARPLSNTLNARKFAPSHEYVFGFGRPHYWDNSLNMLMSVWHINPDMNPLHPAPFPPDLIRPLILASCPINGIVLDPFMGSGTTALTARGVKRRFIGCDLSEAYVKTARWRLREPLTPRTLTPDEQDVSDLPLFAPRAG